MATPDVDAEIDRLYQLPLDQFTQARNALAKALKRPTIKDLEKPNIAAWAANQLYWKERSSYNQLTQAGERLRAEHRKLLTGKGADIREAEKAHRDAIRTAVDKIKGLLKEGGHAATEATLAAVQETLETLPSGDHPGRLARPLKPAGFEALAGLGPQASGLKRHISKERTETDQLPSGQAGGGGLKLVKSAKDQQREREQAKQREKEEQQRKERQRQAEKELKAAEAEMLRADDAVKKAEQALAALRAKRDEAVSEYQRARLRARE